MYLSIFTLWLLFLNTSRTWILLGPEYFFHQCTDHHSFQLHAVGRNNAAAILESLLQVLLACFSYTCQIKRKCYMLDASCLGSRVSHVNHMCVCVCVCVFHPDTEPPRCERPAAGISGGTASGLQSSDGKQSGCTAASSRAGNCHCSKQESTDTQSTTVKKETRVVRWFVILERAVV